ncbi:hypothetical protein, partial [Cupriavidus numazuensis]|uniref:hypothetical protein n=1 Tax=Cupriavidus numazuensis TaxID=221992 RepID=UPI001BAC1F9F
MRMFTLALHLLSACASQPIGSQAVTLYAVISRRLSNGSLNEDDGVHPPQEDTDEREIPGTES